MQLPEGFKDEFNLTGGKKDQTKVTKGSDL